MGIEGLKRDFVKLFKCMEIRDYDTALLNIHVLVLDLNYFMQTEFSSRNVCNLPNEKFAETVNNNYFSKTCDIIDNVVQRYKPLVMLYLAADCGHTYAKTYEKVNKRKKDKTNSIGFEHIKIKHLAKHMILDRLGDFFEDKAKNDPLYAELTVYLDKSFGEADGKFFNFVTSEIRAGRWNDEFTVGVSSTDSDMLVMSLFCPVKDIVFLDTDVIFVNLVREILASYFSCDMGELMFYLDNLKAVMFIYGCDYFPSYKKFNAESFIRVLNLLRSYISSGMFLCSRDGILNYNVIGRFLGDLGINKKGPSDQHILLHFAKGMYLHFHQLSGTILDSSYCFYTASVSIPDSNGFLSFLCNITESQIQKIESVYYPDKQLNNDFVSKFLVHISKADAACYMTKKYYKSAKFQEILRKKSKKADNAIMFSEDIIAEIQDDLLKEYPDLCFVSPGLFISKNSKYTDYKGLKSNFPRYKDARHSIMVDDNLNVTYSTVNEPQIITQKVYIGPYPCRFPIYYKSRKEKQSLKYVDSSLRLCWRNVPVHPSQLSFASASYTRNVLFRYFPDLKSFPAILKNGNSAFLFDKISEGCTSARCKVISLPEFIYPDIHTKWISLDDCIQGKVFPGFAYPSFVRETLLKVFFSKPIGSALFVRSGKAIKGLCGITFYFKGEFYFTKRALDYYKNYLEYIRNYKKVFRIIKNSDSKLEKDVLDICEDIRRWVRSNNPFLEHKYENFPIPIYCYSDVCEFLSGITLEYKTISRFNRNNMITSFSKVNCGKLRLMQPCIFADPKHTRFGYFGYYMGDYVLTTQKMRYTYNLSGHPGINVFSNERGLIPL